MKIIQVAVIDDSYQFFKYLRKKLTHSDYEPKFVYFGDSDSFIDYLQVDNKMPHFLIVDRFIKSYDIFCDDFVETCRDLGFDRKIALVSNNPPSNQVSKSKKGRFDYIIQKNTTTMIHALKTFIYE